MDTQWMLRRIRQRGLSQRFLAQRMGLGAAALCHKLHGRRPTTLEQAACLARWLGMDAQEMAEHFFGHESCMKQ